MEIDLESDGSGELTMEFEFSEELYEVGVFDESDVARPIPVTRDEFEEAALVSGARLRRYRFSNNDGTIRVSARLSFPNLQSLQLLLGADRVSLESHEDAGEFSYRLADGVAEPSPGLAAALDQYSIDLELRAPQEIASVSHGDISDSRTVAYSVTLEELATMREPLVWQVRW